MPMIWFKHIHFTTIGFQLYNYYPLLSDATDLRRHGAHCDVIIMIKYGATGPQQGTHYGSVTRHLVIISYGPFDVE